MKRILVCDDDRKIVDIVKAYLIKEGYQVETAYDGEECLTKINTQDISLIVLDVMMPKMDGFEACKNIRLTKDIPIILLTARVEQAERILGLELGADDYIIKPFSPRELVARVKAHLRRYRYDRENNGCQI
jgi:DNA-binding response OmpR family regulator